VTDFAETIRRSTQRAAWEKLRSPEMVQTGRAIRPGGGGGGWPIPISPPIVFYSTTSRRLTRADHMGHWLFFRTCGDISDPVIYADFDIILPADPVVGDFYFMTCQGGTPSYAHIFSSDIVDQKISMPSEEWVGPHKYIELACAYGTGWSPAGFLMLILACNAANSWICVDATTSIVVAGEIPT
jgi:hypothetical protein